MSARNIGRVKFFNTTKGFGFITGPLGSEGTPQQDYYFHFSDLAPSSSNYPVKVHAGEYVEYSIKETGNDDPEKQYAASKITGPYEGPLMMDVPRRRQRRRRPPQEYDDGHTNSDA